MTPKTHPIKIEGEGIPPATAQKLLEELILSVDNLTHEVAISNKLRAQIYILDIGVRNLGQENLNKVFDHLAKVDPMCVLTEAEEVYACVHPDESEMAIRKSLHLKALLGELDIQPAKNGQPGEFVFGKPEELKKAMDDAGEGPGQENKDAA